MNRKLILSLILFLVIAYINEWFAVNQPDPGAAPKLTKYKGVKDELHETFDEIPSLYPNLLLLFFIIYFVIRSFMFKDTVNIYIKFFIITGIIFIIRVLSFSLTRLPFTWDHCSNKSKWGHRFFFLYDIESCGDYLISGHTVFGTLIYLIVLQHSKNKYEKIILGILTFLLYFTTIISRLHYTIDVINGIIFPVLGWYLYDCNKRINK